jgi:hypothetical protein
VQRSLLIWPTASSWPTPTATSSGYAQAEHRASCSGTVAESANRATPGAPQPEQNASRILNISGPGNSVAAAICGQRAMPPPESRIRAGL